MVFANSNFELPEINAIQPKEAISLSPNLQNYVMLSDKDVMQSFFLSLFFVELLAYMLLALNSLASFL